MYIKFKHIVMHNFLCFEHEEFDLDNLGYTIVSGVNNYKPDNATSNGSGKSSIFSALSFALTGETLQGLTNGLQNVYTDANDCWVQLQMFVDNDEYLLKRIKTPKQDLVIYLNGQNISGKGIKESSEILKERLPDLTSILLGSTIILGQGLPYKFTDGHPGKRKEKLEKLTKSDYIIQSVKDKLDTRGHDLKNILRMHEDAITSKKAEINVYEQQVAQYTSLLESIESGVANEITLKKLEQELEIANKECEKNDLKLKELDAQISTNSKASNTLYDNYRKKEEEQLKDLLSEQESLKVEYAVVDKEVKKAKSIGNVCPTCGQPVPESFKTNINSQKKVLNKYRKKLDTILNNINLIKETLKAEYDQQISSLEEQYKALYAERLEVFNLLNKSMNTVMELHTKIDNVKRIISDYNNLTANLTEISSKVTALKKEITGLETKVTEDKNRLTINTNLVSLAKREFRGILLADTINYINERVKKYSAEIFDNSQLTFSLNDNYIDIIYNGKYYESLSGGEQQKVDIIIQLALRDVLQMYLGLNCNILVVDEVFDFLDYAGCQKILNLITNLPSIESVFIISHHINELQITYDTEVIVTKGDNGCSAISIR